MIPSNSPMRQTPLPLGSIGGDVLGVQTEIHEGVGAAVGGGHDPDERHKVLVEDPWVPEGRDGLEDRVGGGAEQERDHDDGRHPEGPGLGPGRPRVTGGQVFGPGPYHVGDSGVEDDQDHYRGGEDGC